MPPEIPLDVPVGRAGAHIHGGLRLDAEVQGLSPTCDDFLHVFPLSHLAVLSIKGGKPSTTTTKNYPVLGCSGKGIHLKVGITNAIHQKTQRSDLQWLCIYLPSVRCVRTSVVFDCLFQLKVFKNVVGVQ